METKSQQILLGTSVMASDGYIGKVDRVIAEPETGALMYLVVKDEEHNDILTVPSSLLKADRVGNEISLQATKEELRQQTEVVIPSEKSIPYYTGNELHIPLTKERLKVAKKETESGEVRLHKTVVEVEETIQVPLTHDEIQIERRPINQPASEPVEPFYEGDVLIIPIMKEVLVVQKQLIVTEEVRVSRRPVTEQQEVRDRVHQERIDLEEGSQFLSR
jgi:uncharacterized protein (TIGR02271 family)